MNPRLLAPAAALVSSLFISSADASDWPGWRGARRDAVVPAGEAVPAKLPESPKTVWRVPAGDGWAAPVIVGSSVFLIDLQNEKETVRALDAATGAEKWKTPIDEHFKDGFGLGARCTPLVDSGRVYAVSSRGELQCLDAATGKSIWRKNYIKDFGAIFIGEKGTSAGASRHGNSASPLVDGEHLIVLPGATGASVVCLKKDTGEVVWKSEDDVAGYSAPVVAELAGVRQVVVFTAIGLIGVNRTDGKLLWRVPLKTGNGRHVTTPVVIGDTVYVGSHRIGLVAIKVEKDGAGQKTTTLWTNKEAAMNFASPVAIGEHIYGLGPAKKVLCASAKTGEVAWADTTMMESPMDRAYAAFTVLDKNVLVLTDTGNLFLVAGDPKECKILGKTKVCGQNWCNPAYADGKLYLRDSAEFLCVQLAP